MSKKIPDGLGWPARLVYHGIFSILSTSAARFGQAGFGLAENGNAHNI